VPECPPAARLQLLLNGELPAEVAKGLEGHVERCAGCQRVLDRLTADPVADRLRPTPPAPAAPSFLATTFMQRVRTAGRGGSAPAGPPSVPGYRVEREISRGGMGVVYKATDTRLNRPAAVKMLRDARFADAETRLRFMIEAEAVARLRHPGIVQVYEFGEAEGLPFLSMEYVPGGTLADRLAGGVTFSPAEAAGVLLDLAAAVAAAHRAGVIHRDLKPANVLVADDRESGAGTGGLCLKVADFGLARLDGGGATATGEVMGTPSYMSPEQAAGRGREVDTRTDVYALGSILYELLSGRPPFTGDTALDVLQRVLHTDPPSFRSLGRRVPRDAEVICRKCLAKDPSRRYPSVDALAADLRAYREGRAIAARPASVWELAARVARRHPLPAAAVLVMVVAAAAAFVGVNDARLSEGQARREADTEARSARDAQRAEARARREGGEREALVAFDRAVLRCEAGNPAGGAEDLDRAAALAEDAGREELAGIARVNAAAWRATLPKRLRRFAAPAGTRPLAAAVFADGGRCVVAAGGYDGAVHVWPIRPDPNRPARRVVLESPLIGHPTPIALVPEEGGRLYTAFRTGAVRRFDPTSGRVHEPAVVTDLLAQLNQLAVAPDGNRLSFTLGKRICVWDAAAGRGVGPNLYYGPVTKDGGTLRPADEKSAVTVEALAFADNGQFLLSAGRSAGMLLWGLPSGTLLHQFDVGAEVFRLAVGRGGQYVLAGGETATSLWSIHNRDRPLWAYRHPQRAGAVAFNSDGTVCATADHGGNVACLDRATGRVLARLRLDEPVRSLAFHPAERQLLVGGESGATELWELPEPDVAELAKPVPSNQLPWSTVPVGAESRRAITAVGFWSDSGDVWTLSPGGLDRWAGVPADQREKRRLKPPAAGSRGLRTAAVHPDGSLALSSGWESERTGVWDLAGDAPRFTRLPDAGSPFALGFVGGERTFYTLNEVGEQAGRLQLWEWVDGQPRPAADAWARPLDVRAVAADPGGKWLLVGGPPALPAGLRDLRTGELLRELPHATTVTAAAVHPSGTMAATGERDGSVQVWDLTDGRQVWRNFYHADRVTQVTFGTGALSDTVITASHDCTVRVWHARTGLPLGPPLRHPEAVLSVAAHEQRVLTGGKDGVLRGWQPRIRSE
jgi:WD40 repeat protein/tRNA A-37 threonylcarbamoyl transferase component Bud32